MPSNMFGEIKISYDSKVGKVICDPMDIVLYHDHVAGPNAVRWAVGEAPPKATRMLIAWESGCPFSRFGSERSTSFATLLGTGLARESGVFKYSIIFTDDGGDIVGGIDPLIIDEPRP